MMKRNLLSAAFALMALAVSADEGMWMLTDLKAQNEAAMMDLGLQIPIEEVYNPDGIALKDAVVHFGGGCTGEIISAEGLVLTNHHCGYGAIQQHSSVDHDYLTNGFWAMNRNEELPCKGLTVTFIDRILDVTTYVNEQLKKDDDPNGINYLSPKYLATVADRFAKAENIQITPATRLELKPFYGGNKYYLFVKTVYNDIRMVGAPPSSIGKFGADTDNWMWPRHTGDFSLFRIYADKNGQPAEYSKDNVPLQVKKHLTISLAGVKEGDFTFVMGFPGRNWRYMISDEVKERMQTTNFMRHHVREARQAVLMDQMLKDPAVRIHYASKYASSANYWKNAIGMNEGLVRLKVLDTKEKQQEQLLAMGREKGDDSYQKAFDEIRSIVAHRHDAMYHQQAISEALVTALDFMKIPSTDGLKKALESKNATKIKEETDKLKAEADKYFASVPFPEVERLVGKKMLETYAGYIPEDQQIGIFKVIDSRFKGNKDAFIDACFKYSIFGSKENFNKFIAHPTLNKLDKDWMILFKYSITDGLLKTALAMKDANKNYDAAHKVWVKGMMDMRQVAGTPIYPDANSTLRLTYGQVLPYEPADGTVYNYYTTLKGVMQKEDPDNWEFVVPQKLKQLYHAKDFGHYAMENGEMPVCFIVNTDNTGGNSGSPVFNGKGQLIGTGFDRNYEGLTGDIAFRPSSQRAAVVDIRYTLFIIDKYAGASHIIKELDIVEEYGADTLRTYVLFMGDYGAATPWSENSVKGCKKFLDRVAGLTDILSEESVSDELEMKLHRTIKKVSSDIENLKFNTAIASLMTLINEITAEGHLSKDDLTIFIKLLSPFAPHICEEIWEFIGGEGLLAVSEWPKYDEGKTIAKTVEIGVQVDGKVRGTIVIPNGCEKEKAFEIAKADERIASFLEGKNLIKEIYVPNKIVNFVAK